MKRFAAFLLAVLLLVSVIPAASAEDTVYLYEDCIKYTISSGRITIKGYTESLPAEITIPAEIDGYPVEKIGANAFKDCTWLTTVHLPEGLFDIDVCAFMNTGLTGFFEFPSTVRTIQNSAFLYTPLIGFRYLGKPISIGNDTALRIIIMTQAWFDKIGYSMGRAGFDRIFISEEDAVPEFLTGHITVEDGIKYLVCDQYAYLLRGENRETVELPDQVEGKTVRWIMFRAFEECRNLKYCTLPGSVEKIWDQAFVQTDLQTLNLPETCKYIGSHCFYYNANLKTVDLSHVEHIGNTAFQNTGLETVTLSNALTYLGHHAFSDTALQTCEIPDSVPELCSTFTNCVNLTGLTIPEGVTKVASVVSGCPLVTELELPSTVTEISGIVAHTNITSIEIPGAVKVLPQKAFGYENKLQTLTLNEGLERIETGAFYGCKSLSELRLPASVQLVKSVPDIDDLYVYFYPGTRFEFDQPQNNSIHYINLATGEEVYVDKRVGQNGMSFVLRVDHAEMYAASNEADVLAVPEEVWGYPVTVIQTGAIKNLPCKRVELPETVTLIQPLAIQGCQNLYILALPESLEAVEDETGKTGSAFAAPGGLLGHYIVKAGTWAEEYANSQWHSDDPDMTPNNVTVYEDENPYLPYDNHLFRIESGEAALIRAFWGEGDPSIDQVPSSVDGYPVTKVCTGAYRFAFGHFEGCNYTKIVFQPPLRTIEDHIFMEGDSAHGIYVPDTVTEIGDEAFTDEADTIFGNTGTLAESYAAAHGDNFVLVKLPFTDVAEGKWYYDAVRYCYQMKYMMGVSEDQFDPKGTVTRAMLVQVIYKIAGERMGSSMDPDYVLPFEDVAEGKWYYEAIRWAAYYRFIAGKTPTSFAPMEPSTREQVVAVLYQFARGAGLDHGERADLDVYVDQGSISNYARDAVSWAVAVNMISGYPDSTLQPKGTITRCELAVMIMRFAELINGTP